MLREENHVYTDEEGPEVQLTGPLGVLTARHFANPVIPATEDAKDGTHGQHVVEVRNNKVGVVQRLIELRHRQHHARHTTKGKQEDEANRPKHRRGEAKRAAPHGRDP